MFSYVTVSPQVFIPISSIVSAHLSAEFIYRIEKIGALSLVKRNYFQTFLARRKYQPRVP